MTFAEICKLLDEVEASKFKDELNPIAKATILGGYVLDRRLTDHECDIVHYYLSCKFDVKMRQLPGVTADERSVINNYLALKMSPEDESLPTRLTVTIAHLPNVRTGIYNYVISSSRELTPRQHNLLYQAFKPDYFSNYMYYSRNLTHEEWEELENCGNRERKTNSGFGLTPMGDEYDI